MWTLVFVLVTYFSDGSAKFERVEQRYATAAQCLSARDWWLDHPYATPPGHDPTWNVLVGPDCLAASDLTS